ncbi:hypothetical protein [Methylotetracoccus oryzae]|uniref:hypothetical protein n=1 Tax=Methylotetracoccus oryzae TaxID=1919059 RepID=UPI0013A597BB|nr:hypothetical protein [Methylotetracoccus oryzae]
MYEKRVIETSDSFCCEISYKARREPESAMPRIRYRHVSHFMHALQAVVIVLGVL